MPNVHSTLNNPEPLASKHFKSKCPLETYAGDTRLSLAEVLQDVFTHPIANLKNLFGTTTHIFQGCEKCQASLASLSSDKKRWYQVGAFEEVGKTLRNLKARVADAVDVVPRPLQDLLLSLAVAVPMDTSSTLGYLRSFFVALGMITLMRDMHRSKVVLQRVTQFATQTNKVFVYLRRRLCQILLAVLALLLALTLGDVALKIIMALIPFESTGFRFTDSKPQATAICEFLVTLITSAFGAGFCARYITPAVSFLNVFDVKDVARSGFNKAIDFIFEVVERMRKFLCNDAEESAFIAAHRRWREAQKGIRDKDFEHLIKPFNEVLNTRSTRFGVIGSRTLSESLRSMISEIDGQQFENATPQQRAILSSLKARLEASAVDNDWRLSAGKSRSPPVSFLLVGAPGVGKTYAVEAIMKAFWFEAKKVVSSYDYPPSYVSLSDEDALFYTRQVENEFFEGYANQPLLLYNDCFKYANSSDAESQRLTIRELGEMQMILDTAPFLPNYATLSDSKNPGKGTAVYPVGLFCTSNYISFPIKSDPNVLGRRFPNIFLAVSTGKAHSSSFGHLQFYKKVSSFFENVPGRNESSWTGGYSNERQFPKTVSEFSKWPLKLDWVPVSKNEVVTSLLKEWTTECNRRKTSQESFSAFLPRRESSPDILYVGMQPEIFWRRYPLIDSDFGYRVLRGSDDIQLSKDFKDMLVDGERRFRYDEPTETYRRYDFKGGAYVCEGDFSEAQTSGMDNNCLFDAIRLCGFAGKPEDLRAQCYAYFEAVVRKSDEPNPFRAGEMIWVDDCAIVAEALGIGICVHYSDGVYALHGADTGFIAHVKIFKEHYRALLPKGSLLHTDSLWSISSKQEELCCSDESLCVYNGAIIQALCFKSMNDIRSTRPFMDDDISIVIDWCKSLCLSTAIYYERSPGVFQLVSSNEGPGAVRYICGFNRTRCVVGCAPEDGSTILPARNLSSWLKEDPVGLTTNLDTKMCEPIDLESGTCLYGVVSTMPHEVGVFSSFYHITSSEALSILYPFLKTENQQSGRLNIICTNLSLINAPVKTLSNSYYKKLLGVAQCEYARSLGAKWPRDRKEALANMTESQRHKYSRQAIFLQKARQFFSENKWALLAGSALCGGLLLTVFSSVSFQRKAKEEKAEKRKERKKGEQAGTLEEHDVGSVIIESFKREDQLEPLRICSARLENASIIEKIQNFFRSIGKRNREEIADRGVGAVDVYLTEEEAQRVSDFVKAQKDLYLGPRTTYHPSLVAAPLPLKLFKVDFPRVVLLDEAGEKEESSVCGIVLTRGLVAFPAHLIDSCLGSRLIRIGSRTYPVSKCIMHPFGKGHDLAVVRADLSVSGNANFAFVPHEMIARSMREGEFIDVITVRGKEPFLQRGRVAAGCEVTRKITGGRTLRETAGYLLLGLDVQEGDCGSLMLYKGKIAGILSAAAGQESIWTRLTRDDVARLVADYGEDDPVLSWAAEAEKFRPGCPEGQVGGHRLISNFHKFKLSEINNPEYKPPETELKKELDPERLWCPANMSNRAWVNCLRKFPDGPYQSLPECIYKAADEYRRLGLGWNFEPLKSFEYAANGLRSSSERILKPIDLSTSPGKPFTEPPSNIGYAIPERLAGQVNKRGLYLRGENGRLVPDPFFEKMCNDIWLCWQRGEAPRVPFTMSLKREIRTTKQYESAKTRLFSAPPHHYNLALRRLLGEWISAFKREGRKLNHAVGIDVHSSTMWGNLAEYLCPDGWKAFSVDFSGYDTRHTLEMNQLVASLIGDSYEPRYRKMIKAALYGLCRWEYYDQSSRQTQCGQASGSQITTQVNCMYTWLLAVAAGLETFGSMASFRKHAHFVCYGDDCVVGISPEARKIGLDETYLKNFIDIAQRCNHVVTDPYKESNIAYYPRSQIRFLKRRFVHYNGLFRAPLPEEQILKPLLYYTNDGSDVESLSQYREEVLRATALELAEFPANEPAYRKILQDVARACKKFPAWFEAYQKIDFENFIHATVLTYKQRADAMNREAYDRLINFEVSSGDYYAQPQDLAYDLPSCAWGRHS